MHLIVCLDKSGGMSLFGKRQSKDRVLRADILDSVDTRLWMSEYSFSQFEEESDKVLVDSDYLNKAGENDYCFLELEDAEAALSVAKTVTVYNWNRAYPSDRKFPVADYKSRWQLLSAEDFVGSSHEKITKEVYSL
ncbi:MAG: ribonuclease Z [Clostridia bacterium]|nr:ribonuclease Z [Clostridia bacterium]